jgi:hypothetical protein
MTGYQTLLFFHIASVILWLGAGTTLALITIFPAPGNVAELGRWLGPRVFAPASLGTLAFGLALVANGHWTFHPLWIKLGLAAFATSFVLNVLRRFPTLGPQLAVLQLLVLYATVLDMVAKPT